MPVRVELPVPPRKRVGRIQDRPIEKALVHPPRLLGLITAALSNLIPDAMCAKFRIYLASLRRRSVPVWQARVRCTGSVMCRSGVIVH